STSGRHLRDRFGAGGHDEVAADDQVRAAGVEPRRVQVLGPRGDAHVRRHRAVLLREPRHVQYRDSLRLEVRRHADDLADGDDAGAADPGDENPLRLIQRKKLGFGDGRKFVTGGRSRFAFPEPAALDGDEARAEALQAGVVLVARRLVDDALPAELGLERLDREAVRLDAAVAAALAHRLVNDGADRRVRVGVALAAAALFRGAGLVVDQRRDAG